MKKNPKKPLFSNKPTYICTYSIYENKIYRHRCIRPGLSIIIRAVNTTVSYPSTRYPGWREREREIPTVLGTYVLYLELYASGAKTKQKGGYIEDISTVYYATRLKVGALGTYYTVIYTFFSTPRALAYI